MPSLDQIPARHNDQVEANSDDEADPELVELLRQHLGLGGGKVKDAPPETKVLEGAQYVFDNAIDVAVSREFTKEAAETIWRLMQKKEYSTQTWSEHELHPQTKDESTVDFIFTMDLLNFSFWSAEEEAPKRFCIEYRGKLWTGYWSLVAALQRALDEDIPITTPDFWVDEERCTEEVLRHVFRSATDEEIPMFKERVQCLREAGEVLCEEFGGSFANCVDSANLSAAGLVNLLTENFSCFRDETIFHGRRVRLYKRAQILVADLWACFNGEDFGEFHDIDKITMFADYRIPQMLHQLNCIRYAPKLESHIRDLKPIEPGSNWEVELRGTSIWCVELIKREIERCHPEVKMSGKKPSPKATDDNDANDDNENEENKAIEKADDDNDTPRRTYGINAILIDFFLYDTMKNLEAEHNESIPHHRTRSIWY
ncbi:hypothetical protein N7541_000221 [Penicillium brevicompactum]|uniref:Queuosine 5'-phosphate N-glycosylase/hydrolase n=1 Tax=Penicillium brevicompactum TaxID=5074 RepID=A0A9W9V4L8_PENBR|nr:uncharacterized protein N7506_002165 [Penicillium brevicompactum]KAJ5348912.1 hypothetical protein N7506_002165 [Penicillium brevicompactum]KAJ5366280.1 hypothetical protein N7541_000221 [Penicillium brevicompactum]